MNLATALAIAMVLDAFLGEPDWLWRRFPHPAVLMGRMIGWLDHHLNTGTARRAKGVGVATLLVLSGWALGCLFSVLGPIAEIIIAAILIAQRSLVQHVTAVADGLRLSLSAGRAAVAQIVSRDTADMQSDAVARAAMESAAENLSDGVIAPAFWFLVAGLPGLLIYKFINTADSMIGYRTARYLQFGWASARLDDLLNIIPARLTALLIALTNGGLGQWSAIVADARLHRSPNAGWPEAATARAIDVALAGPRAYDGKMLPLAWVNPDGKRAVGPAEIDAAVGVLWRAWALMLGGSVLIGLLLN